MLQQQQCIADPALLARRYDALLDMQRFSVWHATE
jgi:hypothetical protein